jgi:hypothetical protein
MSYCSRRLCVATDSEVSFEIPPNVTNDNLSSVNDSEVSPEIPPNVTNDTINPRGDRYLAVLVNN